MVPKRFPLCWMFAVMLSIALAGSADAYKAGKVSGGGSITGAIKFDGAAPKQKTLSVNKDKKVCAKKPIKDESLVVKDGGVVWAVVSLKGVKSGKKWSKSQKKATMDQKGCVYLPRVVVMKQKTKLLMKNSDKILHNVHTHPGKTGNSVANIAQPKFKKKLRMSTRYFKKPGIMKVTCDVHDWMRGYIVVAENPYVGITGSGGKFEIKDVPAGSYTLEIWHEVLGKKSMKVSVKGGAATAVNVTLKK